MATKTDPKPAGVADEKIRSADKTYEGLTRDQLIEAYRIMYTSRRIDDREILLKRQQKIFFQISGAGHEAVGAGRRPGAEAGLRLVLSLLSRPRAVPGAGRDASTTCCCRAWARPTTPVPADARCLRTGAIPKLNIVTQSSPTGSQILQAVGCAEGGPLFRAASQAAKNEPKATIASSKTSASRAMKSLTFPSATALPAKASSGRR